jgi:hypothetical protein
MKTIIFFREGLSGHYFKSILNDDQEQMNFRVDLWQPQTDNKKQPINDESCQCFHFHKHPEHWKKASKGFDLILTIQVREKIYHAIYNNFYKKYLIENPHLQQDFKYWTSNQLFWYDVTYYNMKEYYALFQKDLIENDFPNIIEFDSLHHSFNLERTIKESSRILKVLLMARYSP